MLNYWPLSKALLLAILNDEVSDRFVAERVWERLGYQPTSSKENAWLAGTETSLYWKKLYPKAPEIIAQRKASVHLTREIPQEYKQLLKTRLDFTGYKINQLFPRRTRRATALNWLLAWIERKGMDLPNNGPMPKLIRPPLDPSTSHPGDLEIE